MLEQVLVQSLLLLGATVTVVLIFQRLRIPPILGYLFVGMVLGPYTAGPVIENYYIDLIAEFGIVFLLFTIGLSFSLTHIYSLRHTILGLGTAQVVLTTAVVAVGAWLLGVHPIVAFVIGAVFAQSSTTIISKQLLDQGEDQTRHGRLGTALSVFQDITAVPFLIIIPVLGIATAQQMAGDLVIALFKAVLAFAIVYAAGRYLLRPLFHLVSERRSAELFTLTVLFVSLVAAWVTQSLGLSMAFGAFLAGMMLAETEFRHQVESTIRPFRDVLLGLFFVSVGMLVDPLLIPEIWLESLFGALLLLSIKILLVTGIVRLAGFEPHTALRTGLLLAVGGEFGFALLAIALGSAVIDQSSAQIALFSVLLSMLAAPFLIRYNQAISARIFRIVQAKPDIGTTEIAPVDTAEVPQRHVVICGYGRIGQIVSRFLELEAIPYLALDIDSSRVREARLAGLLVHYGDSSETTILESAGIAQARLVVISHDDLSATLKTLHYLSQHHPKLPIMVRTRDESHRDELIQAGATEVIAETVEAGMMIASHALMSLEVPMERIVEYTHEQRVNRYRLLHELFRGEAERLETPEEKELDRLRPVLLNKVSPALGQRLDQITLGPVVVTALVRNGERILSPAADTLLQEEDALVLFGSPADLDSAERQLVIHP